MLPLPPPARGIDGSLVLCGPGAPTPEAFPELTRLAHALDGRLVVVTDPKAPGLLRSLDQATGVWWDTGSLPSGALLEAIQRTQRRGGAVGGNDFFTRAACQSGLLPDATGSLRYALSENSALVVEGRTLRCLGPGPVRIQLAATRFYPEKTIAFTGRQRLADLTALRRYVRQRTEPRFPAAVLEPPRVPSGTLVIVGGGGMPRGLVERFVALAGGAQAVIAVIPISTPDPLPVPDSMAEALRRAGAKEVAVLTGRTPEEVDRPESLGLLQRATGVWFGGGRQWRFVDAYEGTEAARRMHAVLARGGVIGGSSAGASIQGEYMARGNPLGPEEIIAEGYERGLGFLKGIAIDQHFTQRNRFADMELLVRTYPQLLGVGIDEATALVVQGSVAEIVGRTRACFYDPKKPGFTSVATGSKYDLVARKVVTP